jgi:hypothetical protein
MDSEILKCIQEFKDLCTSIDDHETAIKDTEHNEKLLDECRRGIRDDPVLILEMQTIVDGYKRKTQIEQVRYELMTLYDKKQSISESIKLILNITDDESGRVYSCPICFERKVSRFISVCGHTYCVQCIDANGRSTRFTCPMCRTQYDQTHVRNLIFST